MSTDPLIDDALRARIIAEPESILEDGAVMKALVTASEEARGDNVIDLRGIAMERLERRLDRLEDTHRSVIAAAYENLSGTHQVHRAILQMLEPADFEGFLAALSGEASAILRVDEMHIILESADAEQGTALVPVNSVISTAPPGFVTRLLSGLGGAETRVVLRNLQQGLPAIYGPISVEIRSEACLRLDLGPDRLPGLLVMGARDSKTFAPQQATDLLDFFGGVVERQLRGWLA
ncbi:DUF484 family protein [Poseidonocella sedimentorum]|uniref:DUF484 domain-containing protein n=1 Tax=Poseidonocella sedimentorum TaxID=871652 RepID=A0A1I6D950_9RHOB|nr:DUF484 family protein [Poseidonocella sedimentorum]SFR01852.1 hypothetical protein SAMN04515673_102430 [Poseidonocella sedimentorum]